jgi:uncharacterized phage protein (TIGR01671 family)
MRPIKFRGWNEKNKRWLYGTYLVNRGFPYIVEDGIQSPFAEPADFMVGEDTVGQFTGLKDKNGIEIYEYDIIGYKAHEGYLLESFRAPVLFENGTFGYKRENSKLGGIGVFEPFCVHDCLQEDFLDYVEVLGNAFGRENS